MSTVKRKTRRTSSTAKSISSVLGGPPILPDESIEKYQQGLQSVIDELDAKSVMQVYQFEK